MKKKKSFYERPAMTVVEVKQQQHLLQASVPGDVSATMSGTFVEEEI